MSNNSLQKLQSKLKELFQVDNKDLDFGIYKIYKVLNSQIENWIDKKLPEIVQKEFGNIKQTDTNTLFNEFMKIVEKNNLFQQL
jgi:adenine-specific DNA-methyltransferase